MGRFGEAQILDFLIFFDIFSMQNLECNLEGQKIEKNTHLTGSAGDFEAGSAVCAGLGGRIIGWGEACLSLNVKPYLKIGL